MKKILLLIVILAVLIGAGLVMQNEQNASLNTAATNGAKSRDLLLPDLDVTAVQKLRLKSDKSEVNVVIADNRKSAKVMERDGYPASLDRISTVLSDLRSQKIATKQQVGKSAWAEIKVQPPAAGTTEGVGTQVEIMAAGDKVLRSMILGEAISAAGTNPSPMGGVAQRFVRIPEDGDTIWVVSNSFPDLEATPESWLDKAFIDVQRLKEVAVTAPKKEDSWIVSRPDENATDFVLTDAKVGEGLDTSKLSVSSLLSAPTFNDVIIKDKVGDALKDATHAKLTTFDGFVYDVQVAKQSKAGVDKYFLTVSVKADLAKERKPEKDEKPDDKKKKDEEFAAKKKTLEEKLAKEQRFASWVFEVAEYTVGNMLKKRPDIVTVTAKSQPPAKGAPGASLTPSLDVPGLSAPAMKPSVNPSAPSSITTTPVAVPPQPKVEIKPTPSPTANPATGEKPAAPPAATPSSAAPTPAAAAAPAKAATPAAPPPTPPASNPAPEKK